MDAPSVLNVHTPTSSFAIVHSLTQETLLDLHNKLSRKASTDYYGVRVGPGWIKYEYNDAVWNLDDDSDYTIFVWRQQQQQQQQTLHGPAGIETAPHAPLASSSRTQLPTSPSIAPPPVAITMSATPTLHLRNPANPLPVPPAYRNPAYYTFHPARAAEASSPPQRSPAPSHASTGRHRKKTKDEERGEDAVPKFKKQFDRFHSENGVRTVMGQIGPVHDVRMLLKAGYRHVYIARKFAIKHGFIPPDAAPGNYGYGGLVSIGSWPVTLTPSSTQPSRPAPGYQRPDAFRTNSPPPHSTYSSPGLLAAPSVNGESKSTRNGGGGSKHRAGHGKAKQDDPSVHGNGTPVLVEVYLSEEPHFDVVLGRSFIEKRQIRMHSIDPTDVVCLDTNEKIECELVILKDGRGEIVTVT